MGRFPTLWTQLKSTDQTILMSQSQGWRRKEGEKGAPANKNNEHTQTKRTRRKLWDEIHANEYFKES